jgi:hypothetical protein
MNALARLARAEWGPLYATVRQVLARRRLRAIPMTWAAVCLTWLLQFVQNQPWGFGLVQDVGSVRAEDPLWTALLRTPSSLFVPALDLPVWGALLQILIVFGFAEICLGWWRTLGIAYVATLAGTLYARVGIALGPHHPLGLPAADARVVDTGPSAAVIGLALFLCWRYRAHVTSGAVIAAMTVELVVKDNLAGKEHIAAIGAVLTLCGLSALRSGTAAGQPGRLRIGFAADPVLQSAARSGPTTVVAVRPQPGPGPGVRPPAVEPPRPWRARSGQADGADQGDHRDDHPEDRGAGLALAQGQQREKEVHAHGHDDGAAVLQLVLGEVVDAERHEAGEDQGDQGRGDHDDLDALTSLLGPVDVRQVEDQRELVQDEARAHAEDDREEAGARPLAAGQGAEAAGDGQDDTGHDMVDVQPTRLDVAERSLACADEAGDRAGDHEGQHKGAQRQQQG